MVHGIKYKRLGTVKNLAKSGQPGKTAPISDKKMLRMVEKNFQTIRKELQTDLFASGTSFTVRTL